MALPRASRDGLTPKLPNAFATPLRARGVEVWFDGNDLEGGNAWDAKIKREIRQCALFVPLISARSQARKEGYFRREWNLGAEGGSWKVYFKGPTPLENSSGQELPEVSGAAGASAGGEVDEKVKKGEEFTYGVSVLLPGASDPVVDDPRIVIEN